MKVFYGDKPIDEVLDKVSHDNGKTIQIKYHNPNLPKLEYIDGKSDWIDLRASEDCIFSKGEYGIIPLGVSMKLPEGYEAHLAPRSSTFKNFGLIQVNSVGVIDNTFSGDSDIWGMPVYATRYIHIREGERVCQFRIMKNQPRITFDEVEHLDGETRGGFGSTGKN